MNKQSIADAKFERFQKDRQIVELMVYIKTVEAFMQHAASEDFKKLYQQQIDFINNKIKNIEAEIAILAGVENDG